MAWYLVKHRDKFTFTNLLHETGFEKFYRVGFEFQEEQRAFCTDMD
jgi:hypothetical protein